MVELNVPCVVLSVMHVLWECSSYSTCREEALKQLLGARYAEFETVDICAR